jgi:hypothetical protein
MNEITLYTIRQFAQAQPAMSEASLRWQIFNAQQNGLDKAGAIRRVGRRVYIVGERYLSWLDGQGSAKA